MTTFLDANITFTLEQAMGEFDQWTNTKTSTFGDQKFQQIVEKVKRAAEGLQTIDLNLHYHWFEIGFDFFYGEKAGSTKYIPISLLDGHAIKWQIEDNQDSYWPIKDPVTNAYFIAKISKKAFKPHESQYVSTKDYIKNIVQQQAQENECILEALSPYAKHIQYGVGDLLYCRIRERYPHYPDLPKLSRNELYILYAN